MKKTILFILTTIASVTHSCSELPFWEQPGNIRVIAHVQSIEQMSLVWEQNDRLCIFDSKGEAVAASLEAPGKGVGTFYTYDWTEGTPVFATFPHHEGATCNPADSIVSAHLVSEQSATKPDQCPEFAAVGMPSGSRNIYKMVPMQNVMGMVKMQVSKQNVSKIVVSSNAGEQIAGTVLVDYKKFLKGDADFWSSVDGKAVQSVTMTPAAGSEAADENGCFKTGCYYISVLPGVYAEGINISMLDNSETLVDGLNVPGNISIPCNAVFDVDDLMPDDVEFELDFTTGTNPLGIFPKRDDQLPSGNDYTYTYNYLLDGDEMSKDFIFTLYKGVQGYLYEQKDGVQVLHIVKPTSSENKDQCCLKLPAVPYRYLKSVSIVHRGTAAERQYRLQEGYPTPGHYYTLRLFDNEAVDTDPTEKVAAGSITIPTDATQTAMIQTTKRATPYYLQFRNDADYFIEKIVVKYSRTLE